MRRSSGESGSGKTTPTKLVLGLERPDRRDHALSTARPARPSTGGDAPSTAEPRPAVFQNPYSSLDPRMRDLARHHRAAAAIERAAGRGRAHAAARSELLDLVGLPARSADALPAPALRGPAPTHRHRPRASRCHPDVIMLDEPVSALDVSVQRADHQPAARDLKKRLGVAYVFVAHDMSLVRHLCHEVTVLFRATSSTPA